MKNGERHNHSQKDYNIAAISDKSGKYLYIAIIQTDFPIFKGFSLLEELNVKVEKYLTIDPKDNKNNIQMVMVELQKHYNDPSVVSLYYAQQEIENVKTTMRKQLKTVFSNIESTNVL